MTSIDYNNIIRNKIRDFIGSKKWSVSRFAKRYVDEFIELYSRQEAPSTSTARKLIEEDGHIYTEREVTVLDSFTRMDFYLTWLEGQKATVIEKTEKFLGIDNGSISIDSPSLFAATIAQLNKPQNIHSFDDIISVIGRFKNLDTSLPLILESYNFPKMHKVLEDVSPRFNILEISPKTAVAEIKEIISRASKGEKIIGWIVSLRPRIFKEIDEIFGKEIFTLRIHFSSRFSNTGGNATDSDIRHRTVNRIRKCIDMRPDWPALFVKMILACIDNQAVKLHHKYESGTWMEFLDEFQTKCPLNEFQTEIEQLIDHGMPENWLMPKCDPYKLLHCLQRYPKWCKEKEMAISCIESNKIKAAHEKALRHVGNEIEALCLWGCTDELTRAESAEQWLRSKFGYYLVDYNFDLAVAINMEHKKRGEK